MVESLSPHTQAWLSCHGNSVVSGLQAVVLAEWKQHQDILVQSRAGTGKSTSIGMLLNEESVTQGISVICLPTAALCIEMKNVLTELLSSPLFLVRVMADGIQGTTILSGLTPYRHVILITEPRHIRVHLALLRGCRIFSLFFDEADALFDGNHLVDCQGILAACLRSDTKTMFLSATFPPYIVTRIEESLAFADPDRCESPYHIRLCSSITTNSETNAVVPHIRKLFTVIPALDSKGIISRLIAEIFARSACRILVFGGSRKLVSDIHGSLSKRNIPVCIIKDSLDDYSHADVIMDPKGVLSRGLNIPKLSVGISIGLPESKETLLHQWGRIARAPLTQGEFFHFVTPDEVEQLNYLSFQLGITFEVYKPAVDKRHPFEIHTSTADRYNQVLALVRRVS